MNDRELLRERRRNAELWTEAAHDMGATHAFTFNPDYGYATSLAEAEGLIRGVAIKLYKELNRDLRASSRRNSLFEDADSLKFIGSYELRDRREMLYPHCHLAIALRPGEDIKLHQFMLKRWGSLERCERTGREEYYPAWGRPLFAHPRCHPEYDLSPIRDLAGWTRYVAKQSDEFTLPALPGEFLKPITLRAA